MIDAYGNEGTQVFCQPTGCLQTYTDVVYDTDQRGGFS